jgi:hypothetical protein
MRQDTFFDDTNDVARGEACVQFLYIGPVRQWEVVISVWDRFHRVQMLCRDEAFCVIADSLRDYRRPEVSIRTTVFDRRQDRLSRSVFVDPDAVEALLAGCDELREMIDNDVAGEFRHGSSSPLLTAQEERIVRHIMWQVEKAVVACRRRSAS